MMEGGFALVNDRNKGGKRKSDLENQEEDNVHLSAINFKSKCDDLDCLETAKKQCTWRPPIKNEKEIVSNSLEITKFLSSLNSEEKSIQITKDIDHSNVETIDLQEVEEFESNNCASCSTICKINEAISDCGFDKEDLSLSSIETLPTDVVYNNSNREEQNTYPYCESNKAGEIFKSGGVFGNKEINNDVKIDIKNDYNSDGIEMNERVRLSEFEYVVRNNLTVAENNKINANDSKIIHVTTQEDVSNEPLLIDNSLNNKLGSIDKLQYYLDDEETVSSKEKNDAKISNRSVSGSSKTNRNNRNHCNITEENKFGINSDNYSDTANLVDDIFDMSITNSQLAKVEGEISSAFSNEKKIYILSSHCMRVKQEQKQMLQKVIDEVDSLNNTIVRATLELKSQITRGGSTNAPGTSKSVRF